MSTYLQKHDQPIAHEMGLRGPFQHLLDKAAKKRGWKLIPELYLHALLHHPGCIIRLVGQVVRVSVQTVEIVKTLPAYK